MPLSELERLQTLAEYARQIGDMSQSGDDARVQIERLIAKAEEEIKVKSMEIQMQKTHIALLKHLDGFLNEPLDHLPPQAPPLRLSDVELGSHRDRVLAAIKR